MLWSGLPAFLWSAILPAVVTLINCTAISNRPQVPLQTLLQDITPNVRAKPDLSAYKAIGAPVEVLIPHEKRQKALKLSSHTESGRLLAVLGKRTYLVYIPSRHTVTKTSFITFTRESEGIGPISKGLEGDFQPLQPDSSLEGVIEEVSSQKETNNPPVMETDISSKEETEPPTIETNTQEPTIQHEEPDLMDLNFLYTTMQSTKKKIKTAKKAPDGTPNSWKEALQSQDKKEWVTALFKEFEQLLEAKVLKFISRNQVPASRKVLKNRPVFRQKLDQNNQPIKYKARLVIKGFMQVFGQDFFQTYASTSIPPTWRIILALAAANDWEIEQVDFIGAFLNSHLSESIYMVLPEGFIEFIENLVTQRSAKSQRILQLLTEAGYDSTQNQVILLNKALYGLKQGPRNWEILLKELLVKLGFVPLTSDNATFWNKNRKTFIVTYVDDCLLIGPDIQYINSLKEQLNQVYAVEDRGPAAFFLGVQIVRNRTTRELWLHQSQFITEALTRFNLLKAKASQIPLQPGLLTDPTVGIKPGDNRPHTMTHPLQPDEQLLFQRIIGTIMWLMLMTRADLAYPVQFLSRFMAKGNTAVLTKQQPKTRETPKHSLYPSNLGG